MHKLAKNQFSENEILEAYAGAKPAKRRDELYDTDFKNYAKTLNRQGLPGKDGSGPSNGDPDSESLDACKMRFSEMCNNCNVEPFYSEAVLTSIVNLPED